MISSNIQMLRRAKGLTQEALAHRVGVSRQTVAKWEAGESVPDLANGSALAEVLGVTLDVLANYKPTELGETARQAHLRLGARRRARADGHPEARPRGVRHRAGR